MKHASRSWRRFLSSAVVCVGALFFLPSAVRAATVRTPTFSPTSPYLGLGTTVTISDSTSGAAILYCTDTTNTCTPATAYLTGITFNGSSNFTYIRAEGTHAGETTSSVASWTGSYGSPLPPAAPTSLIALAVSPQQINLNWTPSVKGSNAIAGYNIYRNGVLLVAPTGTTTTTTISGADYISGGTHNFPDTGLTPGTEYSYYIEAFDNSGTPLVSPASATVSATTLAAMNVPNPAYIQPTYQCVTNYYVAVNGSDSTGNGSESNPWATPNNALYVLWVANPVQAGVCLNIGPGTYAAEIYMNNISGSSDTPTGYFVVRSSNLHGATFQVPANESTNYTEGVYISGVQYVVLDGFNIAGSNNLANRDGAGVIIEGTSTTAPPNGHHLRVLNNIVHGFGAQGIAGEYADFSDIAGNVVYYNATTSTYGDSGIDLWEEIPLNTNGEWNPKTVPPEMIGFHTIVRDNISFYNEEININGSHYDGTGIEFDSFDVFNYNVPSLADSNLVFDNGGAGFSFGGPGTSNVTVRNNTFFSNYLDPLIQGQAEYDPAGEIYVDSSGGDSNNNVIVNNITYSNPLGNPNCIGALYGGNPSTDNSVNCNFGLVDNEYLEVPTNNVFANNIAYDGTPGSTAWFNNTTGGDVIDDPPNLLDVNPQLDNSSMGNFTLLPTSPAIGAGTTAYRLAPLDLAGNPRVNANGTVDIGTYEQVVAGSTAELLARATLIAGSGGSYQATVTVTNTGTGAAQNVVLTGLTIGSAQGTPVPLSLGGIAPGVSETAVLTIPANAGAPGSGAVVKASGTYTGGTFGGSYRTTLP
jgi:hypothetical protein